MVKHKKWFIFLLFVYFYFLMREVYKGIMLIFDYGIDFFIIYNNPKQILPYSLIIAFIVFYALGAIIQVLKGHAGSILSLKISTWFILLRNFLATPNYEQNYINIHAICFSIFLIYFLLYIYLSPKVKDVYPKSKILKNVYGLIGVLIFLATSGYLTIAVFKIHQYQSMGQAIEINNVKTDNNEHFNGYVKYTKLSSWKNASEGALSNNQHIFNSYTDDSSVFYIISSSAKENTFSRKHYNSLIFEYFSDTLIVANTNKAKIMESYSIDTLINGCMCYLSQYIIENQNTMQEIYTTGSLIHDLSPKIMSIIIIDKNSVEANYRKDEILSFMKNAEFTPLKSIQ